MPRPSRCLSRRYCRLAPTYPECKAAARESRLQGSKSVARCPRMREFCGAVANPVQLAENPARGRDSGSLLWPVYRWVKALQCHVGYMRPLRWLDCRDSVGDLGGGRYE